MKNLKYTIVVIFAISLLYSCKKEFDYNQMTKNLERVVVEAYITDIDSIHTIKLMLSSDFIDPQPPIPAENAVVSVSDGISVWDFQEISAGIYRNTIPFKGEVGKTYTLNFTYGEENYSAISFLGECFDIEHAVVNYEDSLNNIYIKAQEPSTPNQFYILKPVINSVLQDTLRNWGYFTDELVNGISFDYELFASIEGEPTDTVELILCSVSKEFFQYFSSIVQNVDFEPNPFFGTTPANFKGNIENGGLGFFQAMSVKKKVCERF